MLSKLAQQRAGAPAAFAAAALLRRRIATVSLPATRPILTELQKSQSPEHPRHQQRRFLTPPPKPGTVLLERRPDRELPAIEGNRWAKTLPWFLLAIAAASVAIFNYQKYSSPVVGATLYALRTNEKARAVLGDNIYFDQQIPWISGEMNQVRGRIDISFRVRGTKARGVMRFASQRPTPRGLFETTEWSLQTEDGQVIDLLEDGDPFRAIISGGTFDLDADEEEEKQTTRGFRQRPKV